ncbi:MAG: glycoside hydrolase family 5 protein [Janthinobacterium lividum]
MKIAFFLLLLLTGSQTASSAAPAATGSVLPMLHAQGTNIVDSSGNTVTLTGINLGGWLVEEMWMQPFVTTPPSGSAFKPIKDHVSLWGTISDRFGAAGKTRVQTAFRQAWINESDFARIQAAGFNCVRLPFLASIVDEPGGLHWLDQAVAWAGAHKIYVILDLHGAPGSQSDQGHTGQADVNSFFKDPANISQAEAIWTQISRRYQNNPTVAGYDMLNEPTGTPNSDTLYVVQDRLYRAIRAGDSKHLIFIEDGYTGVQWMPFPAPSGWTNVAYSTHYYDFSAKTTEEQQKAFNDYLASNEKEQDRRQIPYYVGEYGLEPHGTAGTLSNAIQALKDKHISSSMWTYKVMWTGGGQSLWSLYSNAKPVTPLDPFQDSEGDLIRKCTQLRTDQIDVNPNVAQAFQHGTTQNTASRATSP